MTTRKITTRVLLGERLQPLGFQEKDVCLGYLVLIWSFAVQLRAAVVHDGPLVIQHHPETHKDIFLVHFGLDSV